MIEVLADPDPERLVDNHFTDMRIARPPATVGATDAARLDADDADVLSLEAVDRERAERTTGAACMHTGHCARIFCDRTPSGADVVDVNGPERLLRHDPLVGVRTH